MTGKRMSKRTYAGIWAALLILWAAAFVLPGIFGWTRWWQGLVVCVVYIVMAFPAGIVGGWLANGRKRI